MIKNQIKGALIMAIILSMMSFSSLYSKELKAHSFPEAYSYFNVVDGTYTPKLVDGKWEISIKLQLDKKFDGAKNAEIRRVRLLLADDEMMASSNYEFDFKSDADAEQLTKLLYGKVKQQATINFVSSDVEPVQEALEKATKILVSGLITGDKVSFADFSTFFTSFQAALKENNIKKLSEMIQFPMILEDNFFDNPAENITITDPETNEEKSFPNTKAGFEEGGYKLFSNTVNGSKLYDITLKINMEDGQGGRVINIDDKEFTCVLRKNVDAVGAYGHAKGDFEAVIIYDFFSTYRLVFKKSGKSYKLYKMV